MLFNKKRLASTNNIETYAKYTQLLTENNIPYKTKTWATDGAETTTPFPLFSYSRRTRGSYGVETKYTKVYTIYVDKENYEIAKHILSIS